MRLIKYFALFVVLGLLWSGAAFYLGLYGWWMQPVAAAGDAGAFFQWAANEIETENKGSAAFSLVENGEVVDEHFQPAARTNGDTLFPTASFSKFITALAVLQLSERGRVDLDEPLSRYLTRWQLPDSSFDHDKVTIRRLLSHTAGLTDGLGFGDYRVDETVPDTLSELNAPRGSSGQRVNQVGIEPGTEYAIQAVAILCFRDGRGADRDWLRSTCRRLYCNRWACPGRLTTFTRSSRMPRRLTTWMVPKPKRFNTRHRRPLDSAVRRIIWCCSPGPCAGGPAFTQSGHA